MIKGERTENYKNSIERNARHCNICGEYKCLSQFHKHNRSSDGKHPTCNTCRSQRQRHYVLKNKLIAGVKGIFNCKICDALFSSTPNNKDHCLSCRQKNGLLLTQNGRYIKTNNSQEGI